MKRKAPYRHADGSNCWTKNCSKNRVSPVTNERMVIKPTEPVTDLPPFSAFKKAHEDGRLESSRHRELPYVTYKYSRTTQFGYDWDDVTMSARGIIFNSETGELVARPFAKFFNYNEPTVPVDSMHGRIAVTDKLDGSLGIGYQTPDGEFRIATAGSFHSEQSQHATELYKERYEGNWEPNPELTYMWEIIYPENRVVIDYGEEDDIHLIGAMNKKTGVSVPLSEISEWKWKKAEEYKDMSSLETVLASPDRDNREGFIVHYLDTDVRVKYKHEEYLKIHRVATGVTAKTIWRKMRNGENVDEWRESLPEEFIDFIGDRQGDIQKNFDAELVKISDDHKKFQASLPAGYNRKDFATTLFASDLVDHENKPYILNVEFNGKAFSSPVQANKIWERVKPDDETQFWNM